MTLYYEPHCVYDEKSFYNKQADVVITPVIKQLLPSFTLVSGQEDAVRLAKLLNAKYHSLHTFSDSTELAKIHIESCLCCLDDTIFLLSICRFVVPMKNGDLDSKGFLASIIQAEGTIESFKVYSFFNVIIYIYIQESPIVVLNSWIVK